MSDPATLRHALDRARARLDAAVAALADADFDRPVRPGAWTVRDLLSHVAAWDEVAAVTVADLTARRPLSRWTEDVDGFNAEVVAATSDQAAAAVRAALAAARQGFLAALDAAPTARWDLELPGGPDEDPVSIAGICAVWTRHDDEHAAELEAFLAHQAGGKAER